MRMLLICKWGSFLFANASHYQLVIIPICKWYALPFADHSYLQMRLCANANGTHYQLQMLLCAFANDSHFQMQQYALPIAKKSSSRLALVCISNPTQICEKIYKKPGQKNIFGKKI